MSMHLKKHPGEPVGGVQHAHGAQHLAQPHLLLPHHPTDLCTDTSCHLPSYGHTTSLSTQQHLALRYVGNFMLQSIKPVLQIGLLAYKSDQQLGKP